MKKTLLSLGISALMCAGTAHAGMIKQVDDHNAIDLGSGLTLSCNSFVELPHDVATITLNKKIIGKNKIIISKNNAIIAQNKSLQKRLQDEIDKNFSISDSNEKKIASIEEVHTAKTEGTQEVQEAQETIKSNKAGSLSILNELKATQKALKTTINRILKNKENLQKEINTLNAENKAIRSHSNRIASHNKRLIAQNKKALIKETTTRKKNLTFDVKFDEFSGFKKEEVEVAFSFENQTPFVISGKLTNTHSAEFIFTSIPVRKNQNSDLSEVIRNMIKSENASFEVRNQKGELLKEALIDISGKQKSITAKVNECYTRSIKEL